MQATVRLDTAKFDAAIKEYLQEVAKDGAYVVNRQALNVAIKTGQNTPVANVALIKQLPQKEWWPKFVAKRLSSGKKVVIRKPGKKYKGRREVNGRYTVQEARAASKQLVKNRSAKSGYAKSGWLPAIRTLTALKFASRGNIGKVPRFYRNGKKPPGDVRVAQPGVNPTAILKNTAKGIQVVGPPALQKGLDLAADDMRQFIRERHGATAKRFSAK